MDNTRKLYATFGAAIACAAMTAAMTLPAFALTAGLGANVTAAVNASGSASGTGVNVGAHTSIGAHITNITSRADQEITRRIDALNALLDRINAMVRFSASEKSSLSASIQDQISALNSLQAQIGTDAQANNTSSLKADVQSITKSYRIFMLILPEGSIEAAANRVLAVTNIMADLSTKLSSRISAAQAAGADVAAAQSTLADMNAKVSDANTQANAATSEVANLVPDNGNATIAASNAAALKDARSKIQASQQDLVAARVDAITIIKALAGFHVAASSTVSVSSSASTSIQ